MSTNYGVAHRWHKLSDKDTQGKSGNGNMSFVEHVLYSYNTPIANILTSPHGNKIVLITSQSFSATTEGKHKNAAKRACSYTYYAVPYLCLEPGSYGGRGVRYNVPLASQHAVNLLHLQTCVEVELERLRRARTYTSQEHLFRLLAYVVNYACEFNLDFDYVAYTAKVGKAREALGVRHAA